ncbi:MAG: hypothetical protein ACP5N3_06280 [Candidatus Nanoarchaeia archaeon]
MNDKEVYELAYGLARKSGRLQLDLTGQIMGDLAELLEKSPQNENQEKYLSAAESIRLARNEIDAAWDKCKNKDCSMHPRSIKGFKKIKDVAPKIFSNGAAYYYISELANDFLLQSFQDQQSGKNQLSLRLEYAAMYLLDAKNKLS